MRWEIRCSRSSGIRVHVRRNTHFTLVDNHILVPVRLNGSEPLHFVLDSGAAATVIIDSHATRTLSMTLDGELPVSGVGTGPDPVAHIVPDTTVTVGELSLAGQAAIFLPLESIPFFADLEQVYFDGVIGAPFFTRFVVEIDYDRQLVRFTEPSAAPEPQGGISHGSSVPLEIDSGVPYMTARVDTGQGEPVAVKLLVDTGFRGTLSLTPDTSEQLVTPGNYFENVDDGLSGEVINRVAITESLSLADFQLTSLPASYAIAGGESLDNSNGILGNEVLQQFNLVFDYPGKRLLLAPNARYGALITTDRSGLQLRPHSTGGLVMRIAPASAAAGSQIGVGDIITHFDNSEVSAENLGDLKRALASDRESIRLCWRRAGQQRCEELTLASRFDGL